MPRASYLALLLVAFSAFAQTGTPPGPEFQAIPDAELSIPVGTQGWPAAAFDGTNHLVVWVDYRSGSAMILGARVSSTGQVLDPVGFVISEATGYSPEPAVAWNGETYLVVWNGDAAIIGRHVSRDGVVDPDTIGFFGGTIGSPQVVSNGNSFLVLSSHFRTSAALFHRTGAVQMLSDSWVTQSFGTAASDGLDYMIVVRSQSGGAIYSIPISRTGSIGTPIMLASFSPRRTNVRIVWSGSSYLVTWLEAFTNPAEGPLRDTTFALRIDTGGKPESEPFIVNEAPVRTNAYDICGSGNDSAVIVWNYWSTEIAPELKGAEIRESNAPPPATIPTRNLGNQKPVLSCGGTTPILIWSGTDPVSRSTEVYFRLYSDSPDATQSITLSVAQQTDAETFTSSSASLLLWHETTGNSLSQVHMGRVGSDGRVMKPTVRPIAPSIHAQKHPRAASDGKNILVIWVEDDSLRRRLFGIFTGLRGEPGHSAPFLIAEDIVGDTSNPDHENPAAIAWNGGHYLVAWSHREPWLFPVSSPLERIRYTRVTADGLVLDPVGILVPESVRRVGQTRPALAAAGSGPAFLAWQDGEEYLGCMITCPPPPPLPRIAGVLIAPGGTPASSEELILSQGLNQLRPSVAWNGHHFLIAWKNTEHLRIEATRISADGRVIPGGDGAEVLIIGDRTYTPDPLAIVADGDRFVVAWTDPAYSAIFASSVDREGNVDGSRTVSSGPDKRRPALLRTNAGGLLFFYDRSVPEPPFVHVRRIFGMGTTGYSVRRRPAR